MYNPEGSGPYQNFCNVSFTLICPLNQVSCIFPPTGYPNVPIHPLSSSEIDLKYKSDLALLMLKTLQHLFLR